MNLARIARASLFFSASLASLASLGGCAVSADPSASDEAEAEAKPFTRTIVVLNADGTRTVSTSQISAREQAQELADRMAGPHLEGIYGGPGIPLGCALSTTVLYDQPNYTGNELCFHGSYTSAPQAFNLHAYAHAGGDYWFDCILTDILTDTCGSAGTSHVASYLTDEPGAFSTTQQTLNSSSCFNFSNGDANVVAQVVNDEYLWLGAQCYGTISKGP